MPCMTLRRSDLPRSSRLEAGAGSARADSYSGHLRKRACNSRYQRYSYNSRAFCDGVSQKETAPSNNTFVKAIKAFSPTGSTALAITKLRLFIVEGTIA